MASLENPSTSRPNLPSSASSSTLTDQRSATSSWRKVLGSLDNEQSMSSDSEGVDTATEEVEEEGDDGQSFIGISIGKEQDRLRAPQTPAADKWAALGDEDPFDAALRERTYGENESESPPAEDLIDQAHAVTFEPQVDGERPYNVVRDRRNSRPPRSEGAMAAAMKRGEAQRPRAHSGPTAHDLQSSKKMINFNLPSLPSMPKFSGPHRFSIPSIDSAMTWMRGEDQAVSGRSERDLPDARAAGPDHLESMGKITSQRPHLLRHATSEGSFGLHRSASRASSLGDDTRWEHIHEQVNSRMKAIKDSFADSNLRLPRFKVPWSDSNKSDTALDRSRERSREVSSSSGPSIGPTKLSKRGSQEPMGSSKRSMLEHPNFTTALQNLTGDVVILGGYRGSVLRSAEPGTRQVWIPIKVGLNIRKVNLEVGLEYEDELKMEDTIFSSGMLQNIGPVDISKRLFKRLRACDNAQEGKLRVWDYGYDWRLSPRLLSRQLEQYLERLPCNRPGVPDHQRGVTIIAHSLGGLITRHVVNNRPELFAGVIYAGVPYNCVNILGPLRNGDEVLLSSKVLTAQVNFTVRTSYALLPLNGECFIDEVTKERYNVDFFDPKTYEEYRLTPCLARPLPPLRHVEQSQGVVTTLAESLANAMGGRKLSVPKKLSSFGGSQPSKGKTVDNKRPEDAEKDATRGNGMSSPPSDPVGTSMGTLPNPQMNDQDEETTVSTAVTIPKDKAMEYLTRTLADTKQWKLELEYRPALAHRYPPAAVIYGKSTPTVCGARVRSREAIKHADAYDNLAFASGDGVVLARAAQIPPGYHAVKGGVVPSDRGHVTLLGDLEAVGRCLCAIAAERRRRAAGSAASTEHMEKEERWQWTSAAKVDVARPAEVETQFAPVA